MNEAQHTAVRRSVGSAFTTNSLLDYEESINTTLAELVQALDQDSRQSSEGKINMTHWMQLFAIDVLMRIAFSESLGFMQKGKDVDGVLGAIVARFDHWGHWAAVPGLDYALNKSKWSSILTSFWRKLTSPSGSSPPTSSPLASVSMSRMQDRAKIRASNEKEKDISQEQNDLLDKFLRGQAAHSSLLSQDGVLGIIMSTIGAGADTTGGTLTYTLYLLAKYPHTKEKLYSELRDALDKGIISSSNPDSDSPELKWTDVNTKLPYLDAVLKESMRVIPISAWGLDRVVPAQGATIAGRYFPPGTVVGCQIDAVHLDKTVFGDDADQFRPERWLEGEEDDQRRKAMARSFLAFSAGKRVCMGIHIAWLELKKTIPIIVKNFDVCIYSYSAPVYRYTGHGYTNSYVLI